MTKKFSASFDIGCTNELKCNPAASRHILLMPGHFGKITELNLFHTDMCPNSVQAFVTGSAKAFHVCVFYTASQK